MQNLRYVGKNLFVEKLSIKNILKKGASLIELMVAIVLLAIILGNSFFMQIGAVKLVEGANRAELASELAQEKLCGLTKT